MVDHRPETGWCIIEECREHKIIGEPKYVGLNQYWVMYSEDNLWYDHGKFGTMQKAMKRMKQIEDGEIEPW